MYVPFNQLTHAAKIWIYQANRPITPHEHKELLKETIAFLTTWTTHGASLRSSVNILHTHFFILATDIHPRITNCAVDTSIRFVQKIEQEFSIRLLERTQVIVKIAEQTRIISIDKLQEKLREGIIAADTLFFDNTITTKGALSHHWLVPIQHTWLYKHIKMKNHAY